MLTIIKIMLQDILDSPFNKALQFTDRRFQS